MNGRTAISVHPFHVWDEIDSGLRRTLGAADHANDFVGDIAGLAESILTLTETAPDAALAGILLKDASHYACAHSLHVAILAAIIVHRLSWPLAARRDVVQAALSMNVAMIELQAILQHQREPLSDAQRREVNTHPQRAYQFLFGLGAYSQHWLEAVRLHHEQLALPAGASLQPEGRAMAQLLRILDHFAAKISRRSYRRGLLPALAVREIHRHERQGCGEFVQVLIQEIGLYMPGSLVRLANGETALVVERGATPQTPLVVTLAQQQGHDTSSADYRIVAALPADASESRHRLIEIWGR